MRVFTVSHGVCEEQAAGFVSLVVPALDAAHRAVPVNWDIEPRNILADAREDRGISPYLLAIYR